MDEPLTASVGDELWTRLAQGVRRRPEAARRQQRIYLDSRRAAISSWVPGCRSWVRVFIAILESDGTADYACVRAA